MLGTLYGRLALALSAVVAALLVVEVLITMRVSQAYEEEFTQHLYRDLASSLLQEQIDPSWGIPALESEFSLMMQLNPLLELYWLGPEGRVLAHSAPEGRSVRGRVDTAPIRAFLAGEPLPVRGEDPRDAGRRVIFSAAELQREGALQGFLYVVLQGEASHSMGEVFVRRRIARVAVGSLALISAFGLFVGLVLFRSITHRVTDLDREMTRFLSRTGEEPLPAAERSDELSRLRSTFERLVVRVSQQVTNLEELDRMRRELVANVSHDLRTPLAALRGYLETLLLMGDSLEPDTQRNYVEAAARHTDRLASLVDELFELARLDSGASRPAFERFQLEELVQDAVQPYEPRAREAGVTLRAELATDLPPVYADIALMERVLENLIENALRHTPSGGSIVVSVRAVDGEVEVAVRDTGIGIPPEALPRVFERFYRVEGAERGGGMGLGLAIAKRILELHGRTIAVESELGRGACFRFRLGRDEEARAARLARGS